MICLDETAADRPILALSEMPLEPGILGFSYRESNIADRERLAETVREAVLQAGQNFSRAGLSLPDRVIRTSVQEFEELPRSEDEFRKMVYWWAEKTFRVPGKDLKIAWDYRGKTAADRHRILVSIGFAEVIREYEEFFRSLKIETPVVRPASVNLFNLYAPEIVSEGAVTAWLGFPADSAALVLIAEDEPVCWHVLKNGPSHPMFISDLEMALYHCTDTTQTGPVERLCMTRIPGETAEVFKKEIRKLVRSVDIAVPARYTVPEPYLTALGAALSLAVR